MRQHMKSAFTKILFLKKPKIILKNYSMGYWTAVFMGELS